MSGPNPEHRSLISACLLGITRCALQFPVMTLLACFALAGTSIWYSYNNLTFKTNRADLIDPGTDYHRRWTTFTEAFGETPDMVVSVEAESPEKIKLLLDELGPQVEKETQLFENVFYKIDPGSLRSKGLQYLSPEQLRAILNNLEDLGPILRGEWNLLTLRRVIEDMRLKLEQVRLAGPIGEKMAEPLLQQTTLLTDSLAKFAADPESDYQSPFEGLVPLSREQLEESNQIRYLLNEKGTMGFLQARPVVAKNDFAGASVAITRMREMLHAMERRYPASKFGLTGIPVLENDEMRDSQVSMQHASILSFVGVAVLMLIGFRGFRHPFIGQVMLAVGMCWAFGFTTGSIGHLNILSVSFATMLIGLGIDYAIVYLSRYLELRHEGYPLQAAVLEAVQSIGPGILTSSFTTAVGFFTALLTDFRGIAELGVISGGGILLCILATFIMIPALLAIVDRRAQVTSLPKPIEGRTLKILIARHPIALATLAAALIGCVAVHGFNVKYDYNLLHLQAEGLDSVEVQNRIFEKSEGSLLFAVSMANSPQEALDLKRRLEKLGTVQRVQEFASMLPAHSAAETQLPVQAIAAHLASLPERLPNGPDVNPASVGKQLEELDQALSQMSVPAAGQARAAIDGLLTQLEKLPFEGQIRTLSEFQGRLRYDLHARLQGLALAADINPVGPADFPKSVAARYVSPQGKWLLQVFPKSQIWDMQPLEQFITEVRTVDPDATGTPLQTYEATKAIFNGYLTAGAYAAIATIIFLLLDFRSLTFSAFAISPLVLGVGLMLGIMSLLHLPLNPANLIVLPLIAGIGVDGGVHVVHDYLSRPGPYRMSPGLFNALVLNSTTTMVGFGSMMIAAHRGLFSVGLVLTIGTTTCLFITLVMLPALLTAVAPAHAGQHEMPQEQRLLTMQPLEAIHGVDESYDAYVVDQLPIVEPHHIRSVMDQHRRAA